MFRTNAELDKHSKDIKEAYKVPDNQPVSLERQPADKIKSKSYSCGNRFQTPYSSSSIWAQC